MCAAVAGPVSLANVRRHFSLPPLRVPLNKPCAAVFLTTCFGTSWPDVSAAVQTVFLAAADESADRAKTQMLPTAETRVTFLTASSLSDRRRIGPFSRQFVRTARMVCQSCELVVE